MKEIVEKIIEKVESFEVEDPFLEELKSHLLRELKVNPTASNQYLWLGIKEIATFMESYVG